MVVARQWDADLVWARSVVMSVLRLSADVDIDGGGGPGWWWYGNGGCYRRVRFGDGDMELQILELVVVGETTGGRHGGRVAWDERIHIKHAQNVADVKHILNKVGGDPSEGLVLVDAIQRLGIDYCFPEEIEAVLKRQFLDVTNTAILKQHDLSTVSLCFRLLRQEGYPVSAAVFGNFKDKEGNFDAKLGEDTRGLMGLYEASQLRIEGEDILEEAANFSSQLLNRTFLELLLDHHQARIVRKTLEHPYRKSLARSTIKNFTRDFDDINGYKSTLQVLANMEFDMVQTVHQQELFQVSRWWKDLGLAKELKLTRDQPLKWHMWPMAALTDPSLSEQRIDLTKPISLIYLIDDIFDVYGTLDELTLFTEAVNRWDTAATEELPHYMKICFKELYDITNEIGCKVYAKYGYNPAESLQKTWASLCNAFLVEARWFASGHIPKAEEYLNNGIVSSGIPVVLVHMFFLLGDGATKKSANIVNDNPGIITSIATLLRLWDDLGSAEDEEQDGHDGSYVKCYMEEHEGSSIESAHQHITELISETWKRLNKECLSPNPFSATFTRASLNLARMIPMMYSYDENHRLPELEEHIKSRIFDGASI
ncbi:hypothetical protein RJ640_005457 [Escallonia rubra]|uniref:Uncharacterized protein n=1 Tax=Escallonia rubra TaxID=112253 RepID=A0AA88UMK2_9ASTE|nr:hypothetical protein RJ640_005457 [Escallonia rubra]